MAHEGLHYHQTDTVNGRKFPAGGVTRPKSGFQDEGRKKSQAHIDISRSVMAGKPAL